MQQVVVEEDRRPPNGSGKTECSLLLRYDSFFLPMPSCSRPAASFFSSKPPRHLPCWCRLPPPTHSLLPCPAATSSTRVVTQGGTEVRWLGKSTSLSPCLQVHLLRAGHQRALRDHSPAGHLVPGQSQCGYNPRLRSLSIHIENGCLSERAVRGTTLSRIGFSYPGWVNTALCEPVSGTIAPGL